MCAVVVSNVTHSGNTTTTSNNFFNLHANPITPNLMVRFQQHLEANHHHNDSSLMKRKRPAIRVTVPVARLVENVMTTTPRDDHENRVEEIIEVEEDGYGVYSKRGRSRARLEDRYSAFVNHVRGRPKQVILEFTLGV